SMVCSATYVVTQADVDRGSVTNLASVTGTPARGVLPPGEASSVVGVTQRPSLAVNKSVLPVAYRTAGEVLTFTVVATNTGNVTLSDVTVTDPKVTLSCSPASPVASLAPGASVVCLGSYPVTQTDVDAGSLANTASAAGTSPLGEDITDSATLNVPGPASVPQLSLSKVAAQSSYTVPGDQIEYTLVATNTGNVSLYNVTVTDPLLSGITCSRTLPTGLLPGASVTCTGTYTVTQADIDGGSVTNSASASGAPRGGTPVSASASNTVDGVPPVPRLTVTKTATPAAFSTVGDTVTWTIVVRNTGLATLTNLGVSDSLGSLDCTPTIPIDTFAPGDTVSCTYTATVTAEDAERGSIVNTASATATGPGDSEVTASDTHVVNGPAPRPRLSVTKTASPSAFSEPGETITYTIVVTNTGNVPLEDVTVTDPGHILDCDASLPVATLDIGDSIICTTSTVTTQADVDAGSIHNDAAATGSTPLGAPVGAQAAVDVPGPVANPALSLDKTASPSKITNSGQRVTFTFTVTNVGNVTADNVQIVDPRLDAPATCDETRLAPGESTTCTGVYTVRTADLHGNGLVNSAVAASDAARGYMRSSVDSANVPVDPPELPPTGGGSGALPAALVMTLAGLLLLGTSRRRRLHT
ncbi:MAG: hypothetical protein RL219_47, partial [Actinomycetota bacterium]